MIAPKFWRGNNLLSYLVAYCLLPLSLFYHIAQRLRNRLTKTSKLKIPIVCVGNLVAGGSGKTPIAIELGLILKEINIDFAYLSLGYGGETKDFTKVSLSHTSEEVGDEPILLAEISDSFICYNRLLGAKQICKIPTKKMIIMDDGLQNPSIFKDLKILVVDGEYGFGNELIIPSGPIREKIKPAVKNIDLIIIIGSDKKQIRTRFCSGKKVISAQIKVINPEKFMNSSMIAFCGIGRPEKFFDSLKKISVNLIEKISYPDHYQYKESDLEFLTNLAKTKNTKLVTTKKDWVKLNKKYQNQISYLDIRIELDEVDYIKNKLIDLINEQRTN